MSQMIELPDEVYEALTAAARARGLTPAEWLADNLHVRRAQPARPLSELLEGLTGVIDSSVEPRHRSPAHANPFGDALADKFAKQGLRRP